MWAAVILVLAFWQVSGAMARAPDTRMPYGEVYGLQANPSGNAAQSEIPRLSEEKAREIAAAVPGIAAVLTRHPELERYAVYDTGRRVWTVHWTAPGSYRPLLSADISDRDGSVLASTVEPETSYDVLPSLSEEEAKELARRDPRVAAEIERWQAGSRDLEESAVFGNDMTWTVSFREGSDYAAQVLIHDGTGTVSEVMTGSQVAWQMARGYPGAFGRVINEPYVWLPLCALFLLPFINIRAPFRMLHLDLLVLLSFTVSHFFFNRGEITVSVPLAYPPLAYLFFRLGWLAVRNSRRQLLPAGGLPGPDSRKPRQPESGAVMPHLNFRPLILLAGIAILVALRLFINIADSNVVDVGYSGVAGAHLIREGQTPYGNMPENNRNGDTYGPMNYLLYVPFERAMPWSGEWDSLPAAHAAAIFFDLAAVAGMFMAGRLLMENRGSGNRLGLALAYGWVAYPYTTFVQNCNVNDTIVAAFLIWGFVLIRKAPVGGALLGFATQIKFFPLILAPFWASFPLAFKNWSRRFLFAAGFLLAISVTLPVIFLGDGTLATFWERSIMWQINRDSPFSIWGQYPERLALVQRLGQYMLVALALAAYFWPPRKTLVQMAAGSAALLVGFEIMQTHWFYLYIPWFFPLALIALLTRPAGSAQRDIGAKTGYPPPAPVREVRSGAGMNHAGGVQGCVTGPG